MVDTASPTGVGWPRAVQRGRAGRRELSYFASSDDLYEMLGPLFARENTTTQWLYTGPEATITMRLADGEPARVDFGPSDLVPEVTLAMDADVAHEFWIGDLNVGVALARGQIVATGPVE